MIIVNSAGELKSLPRSHPGTFRYIESATVYSRPADRSACPQVILLWRIG
jgi:hypothetical protein